LYGKNARGITPLGVAVHHFGYEAAYWLAGKRPEAIDGEEVVKACKSTVMLKEIAKIKKNHEYGASIESRIFAQCFLTESLLLLTLFTLTNSLP
jgi:hypothetical protein